MFNEKQALTGINIDKPPLKIKHWKLPRVGDSQYRRQCPVCKEGLLLVRRDEKTLELQAEDMCTLCAQQVVYEDISEMRFKDGSRRIANG
jgi:hypothetical protein